MSAAPAAGLPAELAAKYRRLSARLAALPGAAVAFSGGVDSGLLAYVAQAALGIRAVAFTVVSPFLPRREREAAAALARWIGIEHRFLEEPEIAPDVAANPRERCYFCKKREFSAMQAAAAQCGIALVLDGTNLDDLSDERPGLRALRELGIASPLREAEFSKAEIRALARHVGLPVWDKPAFACLASRIPYGEPIDAARLERIERAEEILHDAGFLQFRVRAHGDIARLEIAPEERRRLFDEALLDNISRAIKACGFTYVALELEGYVMGSLNRASAYLNVSPRPD